MGFAAKLAHKTWNSQLEIMRQKGIVAADEQVEAMVSLFKRSQLVFLAGGFARFLQRHYLLVVTDRRVLFVHIPAFLVHGSGYHQYAAVNRPCRLEMPCAPKAEHQIGAKVMLPDAFATLVGQPFAYVVFGLDAQKAFDQAALPGHGENSRPPRPEGTGAPDTPVYGPAPIPPTHTADDLIRFACAGCGKALKAKRDMAGRQAKCTGRNCGRVVQIPSA